MRNPFKKARYVEKLDTQLLVQWMTIIYIDRLIQTAGIAPYQKVEIVILSHWATVFGFAISNAGKDLKQKKECADRLTNELDNLFAGLNNGVSVANEIIVPRCWISPDGNSNPARMFFSRNWDLRLDLYNRLFFSHVFTTVTDESPTRDDPLRRVVDEATGKIIPISERNRRNLIISYDMVISGIEDYVGTEISSIKHMIDD